MIPFPFQAGQFGLGSEITPSIDDFSSDTLSQYTQGGDGAQTWSISGGFLRATTSGGSGLQGTLIRNNFVVRDTAIEVVTTQQQDGGAILRYVDNNNYYVMLLSDDSGVIPSQNLRIYKRIAGTFSQLGSGFNMSWTRGTSQTIKFSVSGTTLKVFQGGAERISVSDSSITSAGSVGLRSSSVSNVEDLFDSFKWGIQ